MNEIAVPWEPGRLTEATIPEVRRVFEESYATRFGRATIRTESPLEIITFRVDALRVAEKPKLRAEPERPTDAASALKGVRSITLRPRGPLEARVYDFERLSAGARLTGPAIIERRDTTVLVPPGFGARMDGYRNLRLRRGDPR